MARKTAPNDLLFTKNKEGKPVNQSSFYTFQSSKKATLDYETHDNFIY